MFIDDKNSNKLKFKNSKKGHYESYFLRANNPNKKEAFWFRYTIFSPKGRVDSSIFEIWAIYFNGEEDKHIWVKEIFPINRVNFHKGNNLLITINKNNGCMLEELYTENILTESKIISDISDKKYNISWDLNYQSKSIDTLFLLPKIFYKLPLPKAKALVGKPMSIFNGVIKIGNKDIVIDNWIGSQNHNWGEKHTDNYAWGQVMGFDNFKDSFLEVTTARVKIANRYTPFMTLLVLEHKGKRYSLNSIKNIVKAKASFSDTHWSFTTENGDIKVEGEIFTSKENFVTLDYLNPIGGVKICKNSKLARCRLKITYKDGKSEVLRF